MFIFAHTGITLGAATMAAAAASFVARRDAARTGGPAGPPGATGARPAGPPASWFEALGKFLDIRLLIVASLLPDIIDKPLALLSIGDGRGYAHTLVFACLLLLSGVYVYLVRRRTWILALAVGTLVHLVLDSIWLNPRTLLWPSQGWVLPGSVTHDWLPLWWSTLTTRPGIDASEAIGLLILLIFILVVGRRRKLRTFLRSGRFWAPRA